MKPNNCPGPRAYAFRNWRIFLAATLVALLAGCAPSPTPDETKPAATPLATSAPGQPEVTSGSSTSLAEAAAAAPSIEYHAKPAPDGFKLPYPDAYPVDNITPGKRGGTLVYVSFGEGPKTFNPITQNDSQSNDVCTRLYPPLVDLDNDRQIYVPAVLKEWYMESDRRNWILKLRDGAKWSDGHPIVAEDILFTFKVIYDKTISCAQSDILKVNGKPIEVEKVDDLTVRAKLAEPCGSFQSMLNALPIVPAHAYQAAYEAGHFDQALNTNVDPAKVVCNGPFVLKKFQPGERVILERNPYYWQYDKNGTQLPYLDTLIISYAPDVNQMVLRFKQGDGDALVRPKPDDVPGLRDGQTAGDYTLHDAGIGEATSLFWFNLKDGGTTDTKKPYVDPLKLKWFQDDRFRKATAHALDRDNVIKSELRGMAESVSGMEWKGNKFWYNDNVPKYPYDPGKAKALLDEMGLKDRNGDGIREDDGGHKVSFTFITNKGNTVRERVAALIAQDLKAVGIEATPQFVDFNALTTSLDETFDYDACLLGLTGGGINPANDMNTYSSAGRTHEWNPKQLTPATPWEAQVDNLIHKFSGALDPNEQRTIFLQMQQIFAEHLPVIPLWASKVFVACRNKFGNVKPSPLDPEFLWNIQEVYVK